MAGKSGWWGGSKGSRSAAVTLHALTQGSCSASMSYRLSDRLILPQREMFNSLRPEWGWGGGLGVEWSGESGGGEKLNLQSKNNQI